MLLAVTKYLLAFVFPFAHALGLYWGGSSTWLAAGLAFIALPALELVVRPSKENHDEALEKRVANSSAFLCLLWLATVIAMVTFALTLVWAMKDRSTFSLIGAAVSAGVVQSVMGLNVAHELGHHKQRIHRVMAQVGLSISMYQHYSIDHNRGHHKNVATPLDLSSAPKGMSLHRFFVRSIVGTFRSAYRIEALRLKKERKKGGGAHNVIWRYLLFNASAAFFVGCVVGPLSLAVWGGIILVSVLMLESVNYIEHYGLRRKEVSPGKYERVKPQHSWSSNHQLGRAVMFEGARHADHHYLASRPYQILRHHEAGPLMPTGYPGMMLLAQFPPLWFYVMNKRLPKS